MKKHNFGELKVVKKTVFDRFLKKEFTTFNVVAQNGYTLSRESTEEDAKKEIKKINKMDFTPDPEAHFS